MNCRWTRRRREGTYSAESPTHRYLVTRVSNGWLTSCVAKSPPRESYTLRLTTLHEALSACQGHAHDVEAGVRIPTLHLSIYWAVD